MPIIAICLTFLACVIACGNRPLNRVPPKTEFIYTKDDPCARQKDEVRDNLDRNSPEEISPEIQTDTDESRAPASDEPTEDLRMGNWRTLYAPPILGGYDDPRGTPYSDSHDRR